MKKLKAIIQMMLVFVTLLTVSAIQTNSASAADNSLQRVKQRGELIMVTSPDYPPYEFQVNKGGKSRIVGMDIDVAKKVAKDLGVKLVIKSMNFDSLLVAIQTGKADMAIGGINPTNERRQSVDFSDIYYSGGQSFLINSKDVNKYKSVLNYS
ncbi:transporter substrate-binding domain-containing protein [Lentilactobacillus hilgardii]